MTKWGRPPVVPLTILMVCSLRKNVCKAVLHPVFTIELCMSDLRWPLGTAVHPGGPRHHPPCLSAPQSCLPSNPGLASQTMCCSRTAGSEGRVSLSLVGDSKAPEKAWRGKPAAQLTWAKQSGNSHLGSRGGGKGETGWSLSSQEER